MRVRLKGAAKTGREERNCYLQVWNKCVTENISLIALLRHPLRVMIILSKQLSKKKNTQLKVQIYIQLVIHLAVKFNVVQV